MISDQAKTLMRKLVRPAGPRRADDAMTPARAWRLIVPLAAQETAGLTAALGGLAQGETDLEGAIGSWADTSLHVLLRGPDSLLGFARIDASLVAGFTEAQTRGHVTTAEPDERTPTDADAALCKPLINRFLSDVGATLAEAGHTVANWHCGERLESARHAGLVLSEGVFTRQTVTLDLGPGAREGHLDLFTPQLPKPALHAPSTLAGGAQGDDPRLEASAELTAILHRMSVPLAQLESLKPGDVLSLPASAIDQVSIEADDGKKLATARIGRLGAFRAVRLGSGLASGAAALDGAGLEGTGFPALAEGVPMDDAIPPMADISEEIADVEMPPVDMAEPASLPDIDVNTADPPADSTLPDLPDLPGAVPMDLPDIS